MKLFRKKPESISLRRRFHLSQLSKRKNKPLPWSGMSDRIRTRKKQTPQWIKTLKRFAIIFTAAGIVLGGIYLTIFSAYFTITKVAVEASNTSIPTTALSPFLNRLKGRNIIFVRTAALTRDIEKKFKHEVLIAGIKKDYPSSISLVIAEHPIVLNVRVINDKDVQVFSTNQIGYAVPLEKQNELLPTLIVRNPKNPDEFKANSYILEQELLDKFTKAFSTFYDLFDIGIEFGEWVVAPRELHLKTDKGFLIWLDLTQDVKTQLNKLKRALVKLDIYNEPLEYIDLRIAGGESEKVIFKRR